MIIKKKSISAIISVVLLVLVTSVLVASFLSWSKTNARDRLDVSQGELQSASNMDCMKYSLVVESCNLDNETSNVTLLLRNPTPLDFQGLSLSVQGKSQASEEILKVYGNFNSSIKAGEIKRLTTVSDFTFITNDINVDSGDVFDGAYLKSFTLSSNTCPKKTIDLRKCSVEIAFFDILFANPITQSKKRVNSSIDFNTTLVNPRGNVSCEWYQTIQNGSQVRMNPDNTDCDISYTFTTAGLYEVLVVATDSENNTSSKTIILDLWNTFSAMITSPLNNTAFNINKTFNLTSSFDNNYSSSVLCNWSHKRSGLGSFTSFSSSCNTTLSLPNINTYEIKLEATDAQDSSFSQSSINVNILDNLSSSINALSRSTWNNNENITFTGNYDNNTSAVTCEWISRVNDVNTSRSTSCSPLTQMFVTTGSYTVFYKVTDTGTGDVATSSVNFTIVLPLTGTTSSPSNSSIFTLSETITFTVGSINNVGALTYQWQFNRNSTGWTNFGSNAATTNNGFGVSGTYEFRVLLTDAGRPSPINTGYSNTITGVLIANALSVSISSPTTGTGYVLNQDINFVPSVSNAVSGVTSYTWEYSTDQSNWLIFGGNNSSQVFSFSTTGTKYIRVTVVDGASRSATSVSSYNVVISNPVTPDLTSIVLSNSPSYFTYVPSTYNYDNVRYLPSGTNSITVTPTGSGTITVNGSTVTSGTASSAISISDGAEKTITVVATVTGAPSKTYTIKVRKVISTGGTITEGTTSGVAWRVHRFQTDGTFNSNIALTAKLLVVAGGGGGSLYSGKGGDGGQYRYFSSQSISSGNTTVTIGAGGHRQGWPRVSTNGTNSSFGATVSTGGTTYALDNWGDGHGGANGIGTAGALQSAGGAGAPGISNDITGTSIAYAKGGDGGGHNIQGAANSGNGGSGSSADSPVYGGSGTVIIRIEMPV